MTETRPWIGSLVSVAQFVMLRDLKLVDCSDVPKESGLPELIFNRPGCVGDPEWILKEPDQDRWDDIVWSDINRAFSEPVTREEDLAEYAPTQILAETFRNAGYDGIAYGSKLGKGKTFAIFDLGAAKLGSCHLFRLKAMNPEYEFAANPYYMRWTGPDEPLPEPESEPGEY